MIFRAQNVDDEWLEEKIIFDVYRPWDYGHIDQIKRNPFGKSIYRTEKGKVDTGGALGQSEAGVFRHQNDNLLYET